MEIQIKDIINRKYRYIKYKLSHEGHLKLIEQSLSPHLLYVSNFTWFCVARGVDRKTLVKYSKKLLLFWSLSLAWTITFIWVPCKGNLPVDNTKKCYWCLNLSRPARTHEVFNNPNVKLIKMRSYYLTCSEGWLFPIAPQEPVAMQLHKPFTLGENKEKHSKQSDHCVLVTHVALLYITAGDCVT